MKTKVVKAKSGDRVILYFSEETNRWNLNRSIAEDHFHTLVITGTTREAKRIKRYYHECKIDTTKQKLRTMINENPAKFMIAYDLVIQALLNRQSVI